MKKKIRLSLISLLAIAAMLLGKDVFSRCLFTEEEMSDKIDLGNAAETERQEAVARQAIDRREPVSRQPRDTQNDQSLIIGTRRVIEGEKEKENKSYSQRYLDNSGPLVGETESNYLSILDKKTDKADECFLTAESTWDEYLKNLTLNSQCRGDPCGRPENNGIPIVVACRPLRGLNRGVMPIPTAGAVG